VRVLAGRHPRTLPQRRADAFGALAAGSTQLSCQCGRPECPAVGDDGRASSIVVHVVADRAALQAASDVELHGEGPAAEPIVEERQEPVAPGDVDVAAPPVEERHVAASGAEPGCKKAALFFGGGMVPASLLAE